MTIEPIQLTALAEGENGTIVEIAASEATAKRLADMGFVRGSSVEMLRAGRPCLVRIGRTRIGLGRDIQEFILLDREETNGRATPIPAETG